MFDIDNTLLDFDNSSKLALKSTFEKYDVKFDDTVYNTYKKYNHAVWTQFENGQIDTKTLRVKRFDDTFKALNISPASPAQFNKLYLNNLVEEGIVYTGVRSMLENLRSRYRISAITNGLKEVQRPRLEFLNMTHYFDQIVVSDEIGYAKPDQNFFDFAFMPFANEYKNGEVLVVGDSLKSDILGGNNYGMKTCWISHDRQNNDDIIPNFELSHIEQFSSLIK